jgi:hypothetical protein
LFEVLQRLAAAEISLGKPPTMLVSAPASLLPGISATAPGSSGAVEPRPGGAPETE